MKKVILALCVALSCSVIAQAQISTGESLSQTIRTGNRAEKGDFGLYLGATTDMFKGLTDSDVEFKALPLLNFKYMTSDKVEARLGLEWWSKTNSSKAELEKKSVSSSNRETNIMFYPGIAYHFNKSNILDVYFGGELPIGGGAQSVTEGKQSDVNYSDDNNPTMTATKFEIGLGAFVGLQAYVCNLPLAIGLEYGVSVRNRHLSNGVFAEEGYAISNFQKDYSSNKFVLGNQARLTLTYFFKL